jgi:Cd2+/Zn2+-exporting ATPase/Cu+-exporting ATPase
VSEAREARSDGVTTFAPTLGHASETEDEIEEHRLEALDLARIAFVGVAAPATLLFPTAPLPVLQLFGAVVLVVGAWPVLHEAVVNLLERRMTMELSMTIALFAALVTGEVFVALVIATFVLVAELLEELAVARGRHAIRDLLEYLPRTAIVRREGATAEVPLQNLRVGDLVLVNPGGSVPIDGTIVGGASHVDESTITGEPMPVRKEAGDLVYAGTINQHGALEVRAERIGRDSTFGKIVEAVERAERSRAPVQKIADRLAGYLVVFALTSAAVTYLLTRDTTATISVIIVAGACGVAAGTPLAILGAIGRSARHRSIIKGGRYVEALWAADTVVLDKTGTLTFGAPAVRDVLTANGASAASILEAAVIAEARSEHPLGRAIVAHARSIGVDVTEPDAFTSVPGRGVSAVASGSTILAGSRAFLGDNNVHVDGLATIADVAASEVVIARDGRVLGSIVVADALRDEAVAAVRDLRAMGLRTVLLTGDRPEAAASIAAQLGVDEFIGGMLPDQKADYVRNLTADGRRVVMLGDGVNDAPALAEASVGVAMGSGTDVTRESADVVLIGNDLSKFVETLRLAKRTRVVIWQNVAGTIGVDLLGIALAAFGLLGPLLAVFVHVGSELAFILNSARLVPLPRRFERNRS